MVKESSQSLPETSGIDDGVTGPIALDRRAWFKELGAWVGFVAKTPIGNHIVLEFPI